MFGGGRGEGLPPFKDSPRERGVGLFLNEGRGEQKYEWRNVDQRGGENIGREGKTNGGSLNLV